MTQAPRPLRLDDQLCFALYAATNAVTRAYRPRLGSLGLTYPQYLVMLVLWQDGPRTLGQIGKRLNLQQNAITPLVDRLEQAGYLRRNRDGADRRVITIELTEAGVDLEGATSRAQEAVECDTMLPRDELEQIRDRLLQMVAEMQSDEA